MRMLVDHPSDVERLRREIPALAHQHPLFVDHLYRTWSEDSWSAGWILLDAENVEVFGRWVEEQLGGAR